MACHYPDLAGSASDWLNQISHAARPIRSTTQIWVVTRHQYGISALVSQTSFRGETSGGVAKCRLFSQAKFGHEAGAFILMCRAYCPRLFTIYKKKSGNFGWEFSDGKNGTCRLPFA